MAGGGGAMRSGLTAAHLGCPGRLGCWCGRSVCRGAGATADPRLETPLYGCRSPAQRTPLWKQRQRSADLLQVASRYPDFPIIVETYREKDRLPELIAELEKRAASRPDDLRTLAALYEETGQVDKALATYRRAFLTGEDLIIEPGDPAPDDRDDAGDPPPAWWRLTGAAAIVAGAGLLVLG